MSRRALVLGLLLVVGSRSSHAQTIAAGTNVRFATAVAGTGEGVSPVQFGTVVAQRADTLLIQRAYKLWTGGGRLGAIDSDTIRVHWSSLRQLDMWRGRSHGRRAGKGFLIGLGIGLVAGVTLADAGHERTEAVSILAIPALTIGGALLGTIAGAAAGTGRWERVRLYRY